MRSMNKVQGQNPKQDIPTVHIKYSNDPIQTGKTAGMASELNQYRAFLCRFRFGFYFQAHALNSSLGFP